MPLPADTYLSIQQLNALFQALTISMLGMDAEKAAWDAWDEGGREGDEPTNPYYFVRIGWPTSGAPAWQITEDIVFLQVAERDDPYNRQRDILHLPYDDDACDQAAGVTRVNGITWIFYGPNSYDHAQFVRDRIFRQDNRITLAQSNIRMIAEVPAPRRFPELFQGKWWERTDFALGFNELVVRHYEVPYLQSADITVLSDAEPAIDADVTEETIVHQ